MQNKVKRYWSVLKQSKKKNGMVNFYDPALRVLARMEDAGENERLFSAVTSLVTAPVLVCYVLWLLRDVQKKGGRRIYFLARDAYILKKIAEILCARYKIQIECRYLYCSRYSLRQPLYFLDKHEALQKICSDGYRVSANLVLKRAGLTDSEILELCEILQIKNSGQILSQSGLLKLQSMLADCVEFQNLMETVSRRSFELIRSYLRQEGVLEPQQEIVFLADVGWLGSMQRSLRQILEPPEDESPACHKKLCGYYFGMYGSGRKEDGDYQCYYFSPLQHFFRCVRFNNNLFECQCAASHGTTLGYRQEGGKIVPILKETEPDPKILLQLRVIEEYAREFAAGNQEIPQGFSGIPMVRKLLEQFMYPPGREEAELFGSITFCDDPTEDYLMELAPQLALEDIRLQMPAAKIYRKLFIHRDSKGFRESFWLLGTLERFPYHGKLRLKTGIMISDYLKYTRLAMKEKSTGKTTK